MKVSLHGGRKGRAKHNNHDFESDHIDEKKKEKNIILTTVYGAQNCVDSELKIFEYLYADAIEKQNEKYRKKGQYKYLTSAEKWMESTRHKAREEILQIGDMEEHASVEDLKECVLEYAEWKKQKFGSNYQGISIAIHADEGTPHAHERSAWFYHDEDGIKQPGIAKALEELGVPLPDPSAPIDTKNNRMMTYTKMCREKWQQICIEHGFEIDCEPDKERKQGHMGAKAYKEYKRAMDELESLKKTVEEHERYLTERELQIEKRVKLNEKKEKEFQFREDALDAQAKAINDMPPLSDEAMWVFENAYVKVRGRDGKTYAKRAVDYLDEKKVQRTQQVKRREIPEGYDKFMNTRSDREDGYGY